MRDPRIENLAKILVGYSTGVGEGDAVVIEGEAPAAPLLLATTPATRQTREMRSATRRRGVCPNLNEATYVPAGMSAVTNPNEPVACVAIGRPSMKSCQPGKKMR
jgi:hypothetical protein